MKTKETKSSNTVRSNNSFIAPKNTGGFFAQPKLNVGQPGDKYEQEADRVADQVMTQRDVAKPFFATSAPVVQNKNIAETITPLVQRVEEEEAQPKLIQRAEEEEAQTKLEVQRQEEEEETAQPKLEVQKQEEEEVAQTKMEVQLQEEEEMMQMQPMEEEEELLQPKGETETLDTLSVTEQQLRASRGNGSSLEAETQSQMETGFGADFSNVKIHTNSTAVQMNKELGAQAFTSGNDVYFNEGKYAPNSQSGKRLLAHELTHTVQQGASQGKKAPNVQMVRDYNVYPWPWDDQEYCTVEIAERQAWATDLIKASPTGAGRFVFQSRAAGSLASQSDFYGHFQSPVGTHGNFGWGASNRVILTSSITAMGGAGAWSAVRGCTFGSDIEARHNFNVHEPVQSISAPTVSPRLYDFVGAVPFQLEGIGKLKIKLSQAHIRNTGFTTQRSFGSVNSVQQAQSFGLDIVPTASIGPISAGGGAAFGWSTETSNSLESSINNSRTIQSANTVSNWQEDEIENTSPQEKQSWMVLPEYVWKEWTVMAMPHSPQTLQKTGDYTSSKIGGLFATGNFRKVRATDASGANGLQDPNLFRDPTEGALPSTADSGPGSELSEQERRENQRVAGYQAVDTSLVTDTDHIQWMRMVGHKPAARDYQSQFGGPIPSGRGTTTIGGSIERQVSEGYAMARSRSEANGIGSSSSTNISASIAGIGDSLSFSNSRQAIDRTGQSISSSSGRGSTSSWNWSVTVPQRLNQRQFQVLTPLCRVQTWEVLHGLRQNVENPTINDYQRKYLVTVKPHIVPHSLLRNIDSGGDLRVGLPNPILV